MPLNLNFLSKKVIIWDEIRSGGLFDQVSIPCLLMLHWRGTLSKEVRWRLTEVSVLRLSAQIHREVEHRRLNITRHLLELLVLLLRALLVPMPIAGQTSRLHLVSC